MADPSVHPEQLVAPSSARQSGPSIVVAGYDRTDGSSHALAYAAGLAARAGARLVVLNVDEPLALDYATGLLPYVEETAGVDDIAGEVQQLVAACGGKCEVAVAVGDPASVIERIASELHADLIVVGQSRHRWMHPLGSVPGRLAHHAVHPVLIVP
jgi:nucleotide-binding universal stress UspA family protein